MQPNFALLWRRDGSEGLKWFIRSIRSDGSFYGEVLHMERHRGAWVEGTLSSEDSVRCLEILETFATRQPLPAGACFALLARWFESVGSAEVVFKYELGDEAISSDANAFLELKNLLDPIVSVAYSNIT